MVKQNRHAHGGQRADENTRKESRTADRDDPAVGYCRADRILLNGCKYK